MRRRCDAFQIRKVRFQQLWSAPPWMHWGGNEFHPSEHTVYGPMTLAEITEFVELNQGGARADNHQLRSSPTDC
jgi:hypothetical protein